MCGTWQEMRYSSKIVGNEAGGERVGMPLAHISLSEGTC